MIIEFNEGGFVDFIAPVHMTEYQLEKFLKGMGEIFPNLKKRDVTELIKEKVRPGESKKWSTEELLLLTGGMSNQEIANKTNRDVNSIIMKRGSWLMGFQSWARKKGISEITKEDIEEYERS